MLCSEAMQKFIEYQNIIGSVTPTINYYKQNINYFINIVGDKPINQLSINDYNNYVLYLRNKNVDNYIKDKINYVK